jgi:acyl dehydratase
MNQLNADALGQSVGQVVRCLTPRMLMSYSAVLGATEDVYLDDLKGIQAFPAFAVVPEWDIMNGQAYRDALGADEAAMWACIHVQQDSRFFKPMVAGMQLTTGGQVCNLRSTSAGLLVTTRLTTTDVIACEPVVESWFSGIFLGRSVNGEIRAGEGSPILEKFEAVDNEPTAQLLLQVDRALPHLYTEAASIWNPIHTQRRAARDSGLDDILLHGTCTWASAGLFLLRQYAQGDPARMKRLAGKMVGKALVGRRLDIQLRRLPTQQGLSRLAFQVLDGNTVVIADGVAEFSD